MDATPRIVQFLTSIGLPVEHTTFSDPTFLPGIGIRNGTILIDRDRLLYPGDLLHEAGHLAVLTPEERARSNGDFGVGDDGGWEMAAIAWSYAAAVHIELDLNILFHPDGYRGASRAFIENFTKRRFLGVPMLEWLELSHGEYPKMVRWLRL